MGLQLIWSFGLACLDVYAIRKKSDLRSPVLLSLFTVGDWVLMLSSISLYQIEFIHNGLDVVVLKVMGLIVFFWNFLQVTALLALAAACSSAGVTVLFTKDTEFCRQLPALSCDRFQISVGLSFFNWVLAAISSHAMFWILI